MKRFVLVVTHFLSLIPLAVASAGQTTTQASATQSTAPTWERPRFAERASERAEMVDSQFTPPRAVPVTDPAVLDAMCQVPRHLFVPPAMQPVAYADRPLPIGHGQTISQPYIVALMTQCLKVKPGDKVLEIGTGSGYQAAVLSELTPHVFTVEIVGALAEAAVKRLKDLGYATVQVRAADGYYGWKEHAPYDAIIVTCAATHVPRPLFEQLKPGGILCIPIGRVWDIQRLVVVEKTAEGKVRSRSLLGVAFVPLTGRHN
jgi:protein-L-isoaspartate(D-aspartate) O-methyltransferase